ncbi:hypothetical protein F5X68DRAFT_192541 [Plectosphaerella plurivora]|uniref:Uncharacterized protein n=1 Tax=Plectosphaerella plurivora TaxID=936078 RepID=A0A9P9A8R1_9PEZI|nr:hypothetical protein F5X68DRAFT_192541 [Plectosphaerella plurivora]
MHTSISGQHPLEGWLIIQVAELCTGEEIQALRGISRTARAILDQYEVSTTKNNLALRTYPIAPRERILCSAFPERPVIRLASYAAIRELEGRRRKISYLVRDSMYLRYGYSRCSIEDDSEHMDNVIESLERAMWVCTDLADIEAAGREPLPYTHPLAEREHLDCSHQPKSNPTEGRPRNSSYSSEAIVFNTIMMDGHRTPHIHLDGTVHGMATDDAPALPATATSKGNLTAIEIRQEQLDTVIALSTADLSSMLILSTLATRGFEEYLGQNRMKTYPRDIVTEWCVSVAENAYRHGVFFLYPQALRGQPSELSSSASTHDNQPYPGLQVPRAVTTIADQTKPAWDRRNPCCVDCSRRMAGHAAAMMCQVVEEMHRWEEGEADMLPSLCMTIRGLLRRRFNCEMDDVNSNASLIVRGLEVVETMDM